MDARPEIEANTTPNTITQRIHIGDIDYHSPVALIARHLEAVVILVWPYSSSTRSLSFLVVEKDVKLRNTRGQLKVTYHGKAAREVAKLRPGVGDLLHLHLANVEIVEEEDGVSTPGKKAGFVLHFPAGARLDARKAIKHERLQADV